MYEIYASCDYYIDCFVIFWYHKWRKHKAYTSASLCLGSYECRLDSCELTGLSTNRSLLFHYSFWKLEWWTFRHIPRVNIYLYDEHCVCIYKGVARSLANEPKIRAVFCVFLCLKICFLFCFGVQNLWVENSNPSSTNTSLQYFWNICFILSFYSVEIILRSFDELTAHSMWWENGLNKNKEQQIYFYKFSSLIVCLRKCASANIVYVWPICVSFSLMEFKWKYYDAFYMSKEIIHIISVFTEIHIYVLRILFV